MTVLTIQDIRAGFSEGMRACSAGLAYFGRGLYAAGSTSAKFSVDTTRAYYNLLGQYTFPIENNLVDSTPPKPEQLSIIGQIVLTIPMPITLFTMFSSVTWIPLLGNSLQSMPRAFLDVINLAWLDSPTDKFCADGFLGLESEKDERVWYRKLYGAPGYAVGGLVGLLGLGTLVVGRMISNSFKTGWYAGNKVMHLLLTGTSQPHLPSSGSVFARYILGFPGLLIGIPAGIFMAFSLGGFRLLSYLIEHNFLSAKSTLFVLMNLALHKNDQLPTADLRNSLFQRLIVGGPGVLAGLALSFPVIMLIIAGRTFSNNFDTLGRAFISTARFPLHQKTKEYMDCEGIEENDSRRWYWKYVMGAPGLLLGFAFALPIAALIAMGRFVTNNWKTGRRAFGSVYHLFYDYAGEKLEENDAERSWLRKYFIGSPGLAIGASLGLLAVALTFLYHAITKVVSFLYRTSGSVKAILDLITRTVVDIYDTGTRAWRLATRFALHQDEKNKISSDTLGVNDHRHWADQYILGFPGLIAGFGLAIPTVVLIALGRLITNNFKTGMRAYGSVYHLFYHYDGDKLEEHDEKRSLLRKYLVGFPGLLLGAALGGLAVILTFVLESIYSIFGHSVEMALETFTVIANLVLADDMQIPPPYQNGQQTNIQKYLLGFPGLLIGGVVGFVSAAFILLTRVVYHNLNTFWRAFVTFSRLSLAPKDKGEILGWALEEEDGERTIFWKYGVGFPGLILGSMIGFIATSIFAIARFFTNNFKSAFLGFRQVLNFALPHSMEITIADPRPPLRKYLIGFPGLILGMGAGLIPSSAILLARFLWHTLLSWWHLSGSILNIACRRPWFTAVGFDERSGLEKTVGGLGYVLALITTIPVALIITVLRLVPLVCGIIFSVILAPLILVAKTFALLINIYLGNERFEPNSSNPIEQKFRNLYSAVSFSGQLIPGEMIALNSTGNQSAAGFVRKCFTFNVSTVTEKILDGILQAYRDAEDKNTFIKNLAEEKGQILEPIFSYYKGDFFASQQSIDNAEKQINAVFDFIANYLADQNISSEDEESTTTVTVAPCKVPQDLYQQRNKSTWSALFWGKKQNNFLPVEELVQYQI